MRVALNVKRVVSFARPLLKRWPLITALLVVAGLVTGASIGYVRTQGKLTMAVANQQSVRLAGPLTVDFTQDIAPGIAATIEPKIAGTWHEQRSLLGVSSLTFKPSGHFEPTQQYKLRLTGMKRALSGTAIPAVAKSFKTQYSDQIASTSPLDGAPGLPVKPLFKVSLSTANDGSRVLRPLLTPATPLKLVSSNNKDYVWTPETALKQGATYTFSLEDAHVSDLAKRKLVNTAFTVVTEPGIVSARTGGLFAPGQSVEIKFDQAMEADTAHFAFDLKGKGVWTDERTFNFTPETLKPGVDHPYKIKSGLKSKAGGLVEADHDYLFSTTGPIGAGATPGGGGNSLTAPIRIAFDQAVDHASAESHFSINPAVPGKFSWSGNTMTFAPAGMGYQTTYAYGVAAGVSPVWGLPNTRVLGGSFSTVLQTIKFNVPVYKQPYSSSCELTALRMVLAYRGIITTEWDIVHKPPMNFNSDFSRNTTTNTWGNPNEGFVGALQGLQKSTAYGVHAPPIAATAKTYGRNATVHYGLTPQFIAARIHEGNPVIFWGHSFPAKADKWNTPSGAVVDTWLNSHARVVVGVTGSPSAPTGFFVNDSWGGKSFYWTAGQLMANLNTLGSVSNQGVVVY